MADWYCSSAAYTAIATFVPSVAYSVGQIVKPTAPAANARWALRCTVAGTASTEPAWSAGNGANTTTGGATFQNVTGQSTYGWGAAAGDIPTLNGFSTSFPRLGAGDRVFISSDHSESPPASANYGSQGIGSTWGMVQFLCVNRAGSVPPVAADLTTGALVTVNGTLNFDSGVDNYHYGITYATTGSIFFGNGGAARSVYLSNCQLYLNNATAGSRIQLNNPTMLTLDNSTLRFGATGQGISTTTGAVRWEIIWLNTPSALAGAIFPTTLFLANSGSMLVTARGVDLSSLTGTLMTTGGNLVKGLFDSCRIASGMTRFNVGGTIQSDELVELVNCYDGTNFVSESYSPFGAVTTETTITLSGGATDNVGTFSHKMVSNGNADKYVNPLAGFWMDANYATTGSSKTATVEIISSASLNNDDISLVVEYLGTASSSLASMVSSLPPSSLTTPAAVPTSTATWNSSPATPVKQHLQVTFTPRTAGRVRAQVRLGKANTTVYVNPQVTIT